MVMKKFNRSELAQKFMQLGIDVTYMHTNFGGHDLPGFRNTVTFKNSQISLSDHGLTLHRKASAFLIVHGHQKI